jgi:hypothetical protein
LRQNVNEYQLWTLQVLELLLQQPNIAVNLQDNAGWSPLFLACDQGEGEG